MRPFTSSPSSERGASAVEYALLIAVIAAIVVGAVLALGDVLPALYEVAFPPSAPPSP